MITTFPSNCRSILQNSTNSYGTKIILPILPIFFFNLVTLSWITTSGIPNSPEVKFLIVWSKCNHFLVHQLAATNSMHLQFSHPQIYSTSSRTAFGIRSEVCGRPSCVNKQRVKPVGCLCRGAPSLMFDGILNVTRSEEISTTGFTQGNLELPMPSDSLH